MKRQSYRVLCICIVTILFIFSSCEKQVEQNTTSRQEPHLTIYKPGTLEENEQIFYYIDQYIWGPEEEYAEYTYQDGVVYRIKSIVLINEELYYKIAGFPISRILSENSGRDIALLLEDPCTEWVYCSIQTNEWFYESEIPVDKAIESEIFILLDDAYTVFYSAIEEDLYWPKFCFFKGIVTIEENNYYYFECQDRDKKEGGFVITYSVLIDVYTGEVLRIEVEGT